jgi:hypothetical protein
MKFFCSPIIISQNDQISYHSAWYAESSKVKPEMGEQCHFIKSLQYHYNIITISLQLHLRHILKRRLTNLWRWLFFMSQLWRHKLIRPRTGLLASPTLICPAGRPALKGSYGCFRWPAAVFYPFGHPTPYAYAIQCDKAILYRVINLKCTNIKLYYS